VKKKSKKIVELLQTLKFNPLKMLKNYLFFKIVDDNLITTYDTFDVDYNSQ